MCTYSTERIAVAGSAKGRSGWIRVDRATVYYDHPVHAQADHALAVDLTGSGRGPGERIAVELTAESALALVDAIHAALAAVPPAVSGLSETESQRVLEQVELARGRASAAPAA
jgi:hypothetical protein